MERVEWPETYDEEVSNMNPILLKCYDLKLEIPQTFAALSFHSCYTYFYCNVCINYLADRNIQIGYTVKAVECVISFLN